MIIFRYLFVASVSLVMSAPACAQWATRTRLLTSPDPSASGQQVQLTSEVDGLGGGAPTGAVSFADGAAMLGSGALSPYGAGQGAISSGSGHSCALTKGGFVNCWGANNAGQLGDGTQIDRRDPVAPVGLSGGVVAVTVGALHTCALTGDGAVKCWGDNSSAQLGDGTYDNRLVPATVSGLASGVVAIEAGFIHTCAVTGAGALKCWGDNSLGEIGDGTRTSRTTPVAVSGLSSGVVGVSASYLHTCASTSAGAAKCWGGNWRGQLGDGTKTDRYVPVSVSGLSSGVAAVAAGRFHSCALTRAGAVKCWGSNFYGQIGDWSFGDRLTPVAVSRLSSGAVAVVAGRYHSCALTSAGAAECWGRNNHGQLGDGTRMLRIFPVFVSGPQSGIVALSAGLEHTCALTLGGAASCWGSNNFGQLGGGATTDRLSPTAIPGFYGLVRARALLTIPSLSVGSHALRASYPGDALHSPSSGTHQQLVY